MRISIHSRKVDKCIKDAMYGMAGYSLGKLLPKMVDKNQLDDLEIDIHMRKHSDGGEAKIKDGTDPINPRKFQIIIDHHKMNHDDYGRRRGDDEWVHRILETLAHEMVHIKQYITGELTWETGSLYWKGKNFNPKDYIEYYDLPYEIEAHGRERGLFIGFLSIWDELKEKIQ